MYYCLEQENEERWGVLEVIVDTSCEATIIGKVMALMCMEDLQIVKNSMAPKKGKYCFGG